MKQDTDILPHKSIYWAGSIIFLISLTPVLLFPSIFFILGFVISIIGSMFFSTLSGGFNFLPKLLQGSALFSKIEYGIEIIFLVYVIKVAVNYISKRSLILKKERVYIVGIVMMPYFVFFCITFFFVLKMLRTVPLYSVSIILNYVVVSVIPGSITLISAWYFLGRKLYDERTV